MGFSKAMLRVRFIVIQDYRKKQEKHQINNLTLQLKQLCLKNPKVSRREKNHKNQSRNKKKMKETIAKINKTKSWFFEKIKQTKHQPDSSRKKEQNQINKIRSEN